MSSTSCSSPSPWSTSSVTPSSGLHTCRPPLAALGRCFSRRGASAFEEENEPLDVPKEVVVVLKAAKVKLQDCLECLYDGAEPTQQDCLRAEGTHTLGKLMNNNTLERLVAIFDFDDEEAPFGIPKVDRNTRDLNKKKAYYVASLIMCLKHSNGEGMPGWKPIPNE